MRFVCALLLSAAAVMAQAVTGSLLGTVTDTTGGAVANTKIVATNTGTGIARQTTTNESGNYSFTNVDPGMYRVEAEMAGFRKTVRTGIEIQVNTTVRADIELQPGTVNEVINVTAEAALLQTDRSDTGRKIETKQLADMPLPFNRNFQGLLNLVPGTVRAFRPHSEFFNAQDSLSTRVNGQSRLANNVQLDGIDNNHRTGLLTAMIPPIEALQAVDITTSNYEAELGRAGGAVTNVNFKSGTNEFHGSVFAFNRVSALGARNFFALTRPVTTYNQFGFTIGGPIIKNKLFFFGDYQGIRDRRGDVHRGTIPALDHRTGNFSQGTTTIIYDPATGSPDGFNRTPFAGNIIPSARISPISRRILELIPAPTTAGYVTNFETATTRRKDTDGYDVKGDYQATDADRFSARFSYQKPTLFDPPLYGVRGGGFRDFAGTGSQKTYNGVVNYTRVWSPTIISEVRVGVMYYRNNADNADRGLQTATELGIPGVNVSDFTGGISNIVIDGYSNPVVGYSPSLPWERGEQNLNFVNNWTFIRGNHTIKAGIDYRRNRDELLQNQTFSPRGRFNFRVGTTQLRSAAGNSTANFSNSFASFLLDRPNEAGRDLPIIFPTFLQNPMFTYIQDKWVVSQKLTIDIGLRHELWPPATPRVRGGFSNYNPSNNTLEVAGIGNNPMNMGRVNHLKNFAPRFGAAYRYNDKTVFRMGYGLSWVPLVDNGFAFNFPVRENNSFVAQDSFQVARTMASGFPPFVPAAVPTDGIIRTPPASAFTFVPLNVREGYVQSWNFSIQRQIAGFALDVAYVGNLGTRITNNYNVNASFVVDSGNNGRPLFQAFRRAQDTTNIYHANSTTYHSLQVKFDRKYSNGFLMTTAYTWSKAIDWGGADNGGVWTYINYDRSRARADGERRHTFVQSYIYELPFGKGKKMFTSGPASWILGGWQVNGIMTMMTGAPFTPSVPGSIINAPGNPNTPNLNGTFNTPKGIGTHTFWFDTSNFSQPAARTFGNLGRTSLQGPAFFNLDASIFRNFQFGERMRMEFRAESFNFTNTPAFGNPNGDITSPNFGRITGTNGDVNQPRAIQLGLKLTF
jgi:hypothetical protein